MMANGERDLTWPEPDEAETMVPGSWEIEEDEALCECCGRLKGDTCICFTCLTCGERGNKECYRMPDGAEGHGLRWQKAQLIGQAQMRLGELRKEMEHVQAYLDWVTAATQKQI